MDTMLDVTRPTPRDVRDAAQLMDAFARRTAIDDPEGQSRRYLWTDAFAACNFLALHRATGDATQLARARALVGAVHEGLGRHRLDDARRGWISGLGEDEGSMHPTRGGLRIGKPERERAPDEPLDRVREWDRDGQYFHYLTRWMHALVRVSDATRDGTLLSQAVELAEAAHRGFVVHDRGPRRMAWKMSIALDRALVAEMGLHDPIDGLLACVELRAVLAEAGRRDEAARLDGMLADMREMSERVDWTVEDPLGIGCLLCGAGWLAQLVARGSATLPGVLPRLLDGALHGLGEIPPDFFAWSTGHRLGFRELGLAIGLAAVPRIARAYEHDRPRLGGPTVGTQLAALDRHMHFAGELVRCWREPRAHTEPSWTEHRDINEVMLATALLPGGYLEV